MDSFIRFLKSVKAPWVFAVVLMATFTACYMVINTELGVPKAAFGFSAILIGGFATKALLALNVNAMKTMMFMVFAALFLLLVNLTFTDSNIFKDSAVEGLTNMVGGSLIVLIGALLERHKA